MSETETVDAAASPKRAQFRPKGAPQPSAPNAMLEPADAIKEDEEFVPMLLPREVILTDDKHQRIRFPKGFVEVPAHLASHWFMVASGATPAKIQRAAPASE